MPKPPKHHTTVQEILNHVGAKLPANGQIKLKVSPVSPKKDDPHLPGTGKHTHILSIKDNWRDTAEPTRKPEDYWVALSHEHEANSQSKETIAGFRGGVVTLGTRKLRLEGIASEK